MRLTQINVHPVKSTAPRPLTSVPVLPRGLVDDRSWVVVDGAGVMVSARELPALFTVTADTPTTDGDVTGALRLRAPGAPDLVLGPARDEVVALQLFNLSLRGRAAGREADAWLCDVLGRDDLRLVWCDDPTRRRLDPAHAEPGEHTAFADGFPVSLASEASLRQLDDWILEAALRRGDQAGEPLSMQQFRPNLVVDGDEAFAEDEWGGVEVGGVRFRVANATGRCVISTIDPATLTRSHEPLRTLAAHRRIDGKGRFAVDLVPLTGGTLRVGDEVTPHRSTGRAGSVIQPLQLPG